MAILLSFNCQRWDYIILSNMSNQIYSFLLIVMYIVSIPHSSSFTSGRWGEVEIEKGPVDLFPTEPTDEATLWRGDLEPWVQGTPRPENEKRAGHLTCSAFVLMRKMGLEPTRCNHHKILSRSKQQAVYCGSPHPYFQRISAFHKIVN